MVEMWVNSRCAIAAWLECFQEKPRTVSEWTGLPGEESVKRFERSNGLDTALYKTIPLPFTFYMTYEKFDWYKTTQYSPLGHNAWSTRNRKESPGWHFHSKVLCRIGLRAMGRLYLRESLSQTRHGLSARARARSQSCGRSHAHPGRAAG